VRSPVGTALFAIGFVLELVMPLEPLMIEILMIHLVVYVVQQQKS
jgi:hypothetical protein